MRSINGYEYPEPERLDPPDGAQYWFPNLYADEALIWGGTWHGQEYQKRLLRKGFVHLTRESAEQHARAIILAGGGEV